MRGGLSMEMVMGRGGEGRREKGVRVVRGMRADCDVLRLVCNPHDKRHLRCTAYQEQEQGDRLYL